MTERNTQLFVSLVIGLVQAAYVQLGKVKNDMSGKVEKNLEAARITIDTLAALELKTKGNLTDEEEGVLRRALTELRMNYVDEMKKDAPHVEPAEPAEPAVTGAESLTSDEAPGFIGLVVVLAFRNVTTPVIPVRNPVATSPAATQVCAGKAKSNAAAGRAVSHMPTAMINTTAGGGTFESSEAMLHAT